MYFTPQEIELILQKVIDLFLLPRFSELKMRATGEWEQSLEIRVDTDSGTIRGRDYSEQLAKGRKPGKMPPITPLIRWAKAKFGVSEKEATSIAWGVAKKIQKVGTEYYLKGGTDLLEVFEEPKTIQFIQYELRGILTVRLAEELQRNAESVFS